MISFDITPFPDHSYPTQSPTPPEATPYPTETRYEDFTFQTTTVQTNNLYGDLFITLVALVCIAVVCIIVAAIFYFVKKNKSVKVAASFDDEEEEDDGVVMARGFEPKNQHKTRANTTIVAKSIYAVNTTVL